MTTPTGLSPQGQNNPAMRWILAVVALLCVSMLAVAATRYKADNPQINLADGPHMACLDEKEPCFSFIAFGDSGSGTPNQMAVASQMLAQYQKRPFSYALMLGDNIYEDGNIKKLGEARFNKPYKPLLDAGVKFIVALGNHDILKGFQEDQIAFFKMPGRYYSYSVAENNGKVVPLDKPDVEFFVIDSNTFWKEEAQQQWLDQALGKSRAKWKVVMGHHPPFTSGEHGGDSDIKKLRNTLVPILIAHDVDLYLAGHDHGYERFNTIAGVTYIVTGGAGAYLREFMQPKPGSFLRVKRYHFMRFDIDEKHMHFQAIDKDGVVFDQGQINKRDALKEMPREAA